MSGAVVLDARGVHRAFPGAAGPVHVLRGVDLQVRAGEVVTLGGPSGSGKSALLAVLCGFDAPDAGSVTLLGRPVGTPAWTDCAVLPQALGLAGELTLVENAALPLRLSGRAGGADARARELLDRLGVGALADRYPGEVSYGQQQRAALARAVAVRPRLLVADEPTAHLDAAATALVVALLRDTAAGSAAVLVATHDEAVHAGASRCERLGPL